MTPLVVFAECQLLYGKIYTASTEPNTTASVTCQEPRVEMEPREESQRPAAGGSIIWWSGSARALLVAESRLQGQIAALADQRAKTRQIYR
jgi:hypothetical protein